MRIPQRDLLPLDQIETFEAWATGHGYIVEPARRDGVVLRLRSATASAPILFRMRAVRQDHVTTAGRGLTLVRDFLREMKARG